MPEHWCTVTVTDAAGRRHSLDIIASSAYDAAHLYVTHAKVQPQAGLPVPTLATIFEIVNGGKVYTVEGDALQRWIEQRRQEWKGPKGLLFAGRHCFSLTTKRYDRCQDEISLDDVEWIAI
jgi:hypothetical protein